MSGIDLLVLMELWGPNPLHTGTLWELIFSLGLKTSSHKVPIYILGTRLLIKVRVILWITNFALATARAFFISAAGYARL